MQSFSVLALPVLAAFAVAQTSPSFPVQVSNNLRVDFLKSSASVSTPGVLLPRDDVLYGPTVYGPANADKETTYILFMVDQDVNTGNGPRVELLHLFQPNLVGIDHELTVVPNAQNATTAVGAQYMTPSPPEGDGAHRYNLLLYVQPEGFEVPQAYTSFSPPADVNARYPFNMSGFAATARLGQPVAGNWFRVINETTADSGSASSTASGETSTSMTLTSSAVATAGAQTTSAGSGTPTVTGSYSSGSAAAASSPTGAAAFAAVPRSTKEMAVGLIMGVAGAWLWML